MRKNNIYEIVQKEFTSVDALIREKLSSRVPMVETISEYILSSGGKRIRPLLVLLSAKALGKCDEKAIKLAGIIEILHTATLLHDDVVDISDMRRGKETANLKWGSAPSILVGDFLYSRSFQMMVELGSLKVMDILSHSTCVIAEGEVLQLMNCKNPEMTEEQYMEVIKGKTAVLFEASTHSAVALMDDENEFESSFKEYGMHLGMAFQLIDDVLDYEGDALEMGKNIGDDLAEGKPTLPLIYAMQHTNDGDKKKIVNAIRKGGVDNIEEILKIVTECGALQYTKDHALSHANKAKESIRNIPETEAKNALISIVDTAINRTY
jgi:octaprenyl-diphosphate synthase